MQFTRKSESNHAIFILMNKLYIIDAINYLFRSYHAIGPMTNSSGQSTNAVYGFIRSILKLLKTTNAEYIVCVFDGPDNKRARKELFTDYKSNRKQAPEDLIPQFEWAYQFCELIGIPILCIEGVEADDVMATLALYAKSQESDAYLCTSDKDLTQLVDDHIFVLHPHKDYALVDAKAVEEIFGIPPSQILDYLSIVGDTSDNIPGIPGFGPKTAVSLLKEFGTLENILKNPEKVKGEKKQQALVEFKDQAILSQKLATLNCQVQIPTEIEFYHKKNPNMEKLAKFYHDMNFNSLSRELEQAKPAPTSNEKNKLEKTQYKLVQTLDELDSLLQKLSTEKEICIDTETTSVTAMQAELVGMAMSCNLNIIYYIPFNGNIPKDLILQKLNIFFKNCQTNFIGHNIKYDWHILKNENIELTNLGFDTQIASYLLEPHVRRHNLDDLTLEKFNHVKIPIESLIGKKPKQISMLEVPIDHVCNYCCEDVEYTFRLKNLLEKELREKKLDNIFSTMEMPLVPILANMERAGVFVDTNELNQLGLQFSSQIEKIKAKIFQEVGFDFNLNSPKQLSEVLFDTLGLKKPAKTKTSFATGADILEELSSDNPIVCDILVYRSLEKLRATYVEGLLEQINPKTGKIHCTFNQAVTATGRLSCQDPNLQNIPVKTKEGNKIRACFKPEKPGFSFLSADYSQIELRLLAHFSQDPDLIQAFIEKQDIHAHTASRIYNVPITMITPQMRSNAKTVNFGILYGQGPYGLSQQLHISMKEAQEFIKTYFDKYPKISAFLEKCKQEALTHGYSTTLTGRKRPIPEIDNKNAQVRAAAERLAVNTPLQGTAADLIKLAMIAIDKELKDKKLDGKMILQIHDELIFEIPDEEIDIFKNIIKKNMENVFHLSVPLIVDMAVGKNWAKC